MALRQAPNAVVIGSPSIGADGNVANMVFPGAVHTSMTSLGVYDTDMSQTQRVGLTPDIYVDVYKRQLLESDLSGIRVGEIAEKTHLTRPSVSHHLQILKEAGIVAMRREGTKNYYYLSADETQWKEISDVINLIYASVRHISKS